MTHDDFPSISEQRVTQHLCFILFDFKKKPFCLMCVLGVLFIITIVTRIMFIAPWLSIAPFCACVSQCTPVYDFIMATCVTNLGGVQGGAVYHNVPQYMTIHNGHVCH